ncbi:hypothetical protein BJ878DRAFT_539445 [Calycina marina]|uniref:Uncharacterized protein n=1 Tax=Calycina marina TaxID=1763456 RepID=A0A9P8CHH2_9HELO|nr:hypothetical protein BJ878DRAFT_539445 [Calycina marina]
MPHRLLKILALARTSSWLYEAILSAGITLAGSLESCTAVAIVGAKGNIIGHYTVTADNILNQHTGDFGDMAARNDEHAASLAIPRLFAANPESLPRGNKNLKAAIDSLTGSDATMLAHLTTVSQKTHASTTWQDGNGATLYVDVPILGSQSIKSIESAVAR